jgi:SAM-dependent methyltransferase
VRVNIGCGATPTDGWSNLDNSFTVRVARWPWLVRSLAAARILNRQSLDFAGVANGNKIRFANASLRIPYADNSVEVVYSSHMIEHLDRDEAKAFLLEVRRILQPGGVIRLAAPDLARFVQNYLVSGDADGFVQGTNMGQARPRGVFPRLKSALTGPRHHLWMYDGPSLAKLLHDAGFTEVSVMPEGKTHIPAPGSLDLAERAEESVYVEAIQLPVSPAAHEGVAR